MMEFVVLGLFNLEWGNERGRGMGTGLEFASFYGTKFEGVGIVGTILRMEIRVFRTMYCIGTTYCINSD